VGSGSGLEARPYECLGAFRQVGLLWRTAFPGSEDLVALGEFIQERLPASIQRSNLPRKSPNGHKPNGHKPNVLKTAARSRAGA
jgi:hypothetical protein